MEPLQARPNQNALNRTDPAVPGRSSIGGRPGDPDRSGNTATHRARTPKPYRWCEVLTEAILYFMIVFSPWAFGTTERWSTWTMNAAGYALAVLLVAKWIIRWRTDWEPDRWGTPAPLEPADAASHRQWQRYRLGIFLTRTLAVLTVLILLYTLTSAVNARVIYIKEDGQRYMKYLECIRWLPHSYDQGFTWFAFWQYLGLTFVFWSLRDWLLTRTAKDRGEAEDSAGFVPDSEASRSTHLPARLRRLLWVLCINGTVLALVCILQRLDGTNKLLWLRKPHINDQAVVQFGPYAYRSNAAQYFNLVWPLALAFWWVSRRAGVSRNKKAIRTGSGPHSLLLPGAVLMCAAPVISTSRAGAAISVGSMMVAAFILWRVTHRVETFGRAGIAAVLASAFAMAAYLGWQALESRLKERQLAELSGRMTIYRNIRPMLSEFRLFGAGPGSFATIYEHYRTEPNQPIEAYLHNDWLETLITFGAIGTGLILAALGVVGLTGLAPPGQSWPRPLAACLALALAGCFVHAIADFPFQVHSILFLALLELSVFSTGATPS